MKNNSTARFSNRVSNYVKYRPSYPTAIVDYLQQFHNLSTHKIIADIGAGTGISSQLFLERGYKVIAIEPNAFMRVKCEELLRQYQHFSTSAGTAENTLLDTESVEAIVCAQAFHWFNNEYTHAEFKRILKPGGIVVLMWNERLTSSQFEKAYDEFIVRNGIDYKSVDHRNIDRESIQNFFAPSTVTLKTFNNHQIFNFDGLKGRLLSSSYMPSESDERYEPMINELKLLFEQYQQAGQVQINYATKVYTTHYSK